MRLNMKRTHDGDSDEATLFFYIFSIGELVQCIASYLGSMILPLDNTCVALRLALSRVKVAPFGYTHAILHYSASNMFNLVMWAYESKHSTLLRVTTLSSVLHNAIKYGDLEVVEWVHSKKTEKQGSFDWKSFLESIDYGSIAAAYNQLDILKWLFANNYYDYGTAATEAIKGGFVDILEWLSTSRNLSFLGPRIHNESSIDHACVTAVRYGKLNVLKWLKEKGCDFNARCIFICALTNEDLDILKWICEIENGLIRESTSDHFGIVTSMSDHIGMITNLKIVEWLLERVPDYKDTIVKITLIALLRGNIVLLNWLYSTGKIQVNNTGEVWDLNPNDENEMTLRAARCRDLTSLKWLKDKGHAIGLKVMSFASHLSNQDVLLWLIQEGAPIKTWFPDFEMPEELE